MYIHIKLQTRSTSAAVGSAAQAAAGPLDPDPALVAISQQELEELRTSQQQLQAVKKALGDFKVLYKKRMERY